MTLGTVEYFSSISFFKTNNDARQSLDAARAHQTESIIRRFVLIKLTKSYCYYCIAVKLFPRNHQLSHPSNKIRYKFEKKNYNNSNRRLHHYYKVSENYFS